MRRAILAAERDLALFDLMKWIALIPKLTPMTNAIITVYPEYPCASAEIGVAQDNDGEQVEAPQSREVAFTTKTVES